MKITVDEGHTSVHLKSSSSIDTQSVDDQMQQSTRRRSTGIREQHAFTSSEDIGLRESGTEFVNEEFFETFPDTSFTVVLRRSFRYLPTHRISNSNNDTRILITTHTFAADGSSEKDDQNAEDTPWMSLLLRCYCCLECFIVLFVHLTHICKA